MRRTSLAVIAVIALLLAACGDDTPDIEPQAQDDPAPTPETEEELPEAEDDDGARLATASSELGTILVDDAGMTLYVFDNDTEGESTCYEACEQNWPPLVGEVTAGDGVDSSLIGSTTRTDGTTQVTYANQPLYYFAADQAPGDVNGQGVGGIWWVVGPDGEKITTDAM